jgi:hypothetical protein
MDIDVRFGFLGLPNTRGHGRLLGAFGIDALGGGLFLPFSILFFIMTTSLGLQQVGLALSIAAIVRLPATAGMVTDRIGPKTAVIISNLAQAIGFAGYLFVDSFAQLLPRGNSRPGGQFFVLGRLPCPRPRSRRQGRTGTLVRPHQCPAQRGLGRRRA